MTIRKIGLTFALFFCCTSAALAQELAWYDGTWAHETSDLTPDKRVTFGKLDNGVRYAIIPNALPKGRVSLYLNMQVGSLMESENEKGFAHYVEHMAFNGTRHFPAGSLIPFFQDNGMSFGGDTNAHTSLAETVYTLNLAKIDDASVQKAVLILRDFADGMVMDESEILDERGVILSEKNSRESEASLANDERRAYLYRGTKFADNVIGTQESIQSVNSTNLTHFYRKWYRPERAMIVAVGDIEPAKLASMIDEAFTSFKNETPASSVPDFGEVERAKFELFVQPAERDGIHFSLLISHPRIFYKDTQANLRETFIQMMASSMFQQRLRELGMKNPSLWSKAQFSDNTKKGLLPSSGWSFVSDNAHWKEALNLIVKESNSAQNFGFGEEEFSQAKTLIARNLAKAVLAEANQKNNDIATGFVTIANSGAVFTSAADDQKRYERFLPTITLEEVNRAFKEAFAPDNRTLVVSGKINADRDEIRLAWEAAQQQSLSVHDVRQDKTFPYLPLPTEADSLPKLEAKSLGKDAPMLYTAHYNDTLDLYMIPTKYESNQIMVRLMFGEDKPFGESVLPLRKIASAVLSKSGIGALSPTEVTRLFGGLGLSINESFEDRYSVINGSASTKDFELLMQAMWTQYVDPTPKEAALIRFKQSLEMNEHAKEKTVEGVDQAYSASFFQGNSKRFEPISLEALSRYRLEDIRAAIENQRYSDTKLKMIITGDFEPQNALKEAVRFFGTRGEKDSFKPYDTALISATFPSERYTQRKVDDTVDKSVVYRAFQHNVADIYDRKAVATLHVAAAVVKDRLRKELREKSGVVYSPSASFQNSLNPVDQGFGILNIKVTTQTKNNAQVQRKIDSIVEDLVREGVSEEEIERLKAPMMTSWKSALRKNELWHNLMEKELNRGLPFLQWHSDYPSVLNTVHANDVDTALKSLLKSDKTVTYVIVSKGA